MSSGTFRLVVVEDNPDDIHFLQRLLRPWVIDLIVLRTGQAALDYLFDADQSLPDLVLLDLMLPGAHGFDILRLIRQYERTKTLPVVIITSSAQEKDAFKYYQIGVDGFLVKPLQLSDLTPFLPAVQTRPVPRRDAKEKAA